MKHFRLILSLACLFMLQSQASVFNKTTYPQLTNIQSLYIETFDNADITDKENYKYCRLILVSDTGVVKYDSVNIRGRGNASWDFAKKPYRIKFESKQRLLGPDFANAKSWTLLSNGGEKLLFRNGLASYVSGLVNLPFQPAARYVDLYLNGRYRGNYQISDQVQVHKKRVNIYEQEEPVEEEIYYSFSNKRYSNCVLGVTDSTAKTSTTASLQHKKEGSMAQKWTQRAVGNAVMFINARTGLALQDDNNSTTRTQITTATANENDERQLWTIVTRESYVNLKNVATNNVLTNFNSLSTENNPIYGYSSSTSLDVSNESRIWSMDELDLSNISGGYLCEIDAHSDAGETYFTSSTYRNHIRVHSPDADVISDKQIDYIKDYINTFEKALASSDYMDSEKGYRQYIDTTTLMGWYLTSEICSNADLFYSIYFYKERNDPHLYFGPVWDFDLGFNDDSRHGDVTYKLMQDIRFSSTYYQAWFDRIISDDWWKEAQFNHYHKVYKEKNLDSLMINYADSIVNLMRPSINENYKVWSISAQTHLETYLYSTYDEYVDDLKEFIVNHNAYIYSQFYNRADRKFVADENSYYVISNKKFPTFLLGVTDSTATETPACLKREDASQLAQKWIFKKVGEHYMIINARTNLALQDADNATTRTYINAVTPDETDESQLWDMTLQLGVYMNLKNVATDNVISNYNSIAVDENPIYGYSSSSLDATNESRMWLLTPISKENFGPQTGISALEKRIDYALAYNSGDNHLYFVAENTKDLVFQAKIYDLSGACKGTFRGDESFDASVLPGGTYIVNWQFAGKSHSTKFLKN